MGIVTRLWKRAWRRKTSEPPKPQIPQTFEETRTSTKLSQNVQGARILRLHQGELYEKYWGFDTDWARKAWEEYIMGDTPGEHFYLHDGMERGRFTR